VDLPNEKQQEFVSLANSFNGMAAKVEQTVSTLREFVADAAHELHTPLTALQANLELARDEENAAARTRYLTRAHEQSRRLAALVQAYWIFRVSKRRDQVQLCLFGYHQLVRSG
jgi:signal transduction histidine kinase